jgi:hypothetical protein
MFCNQKYHSSKATPWIVNRPFIEESGIDVDLTLVRETQAAMEAMITNNQRKGSRRRPDDNATDNSNNDTSQNISRNFSNNHGSPHAASANSDAGTYLRRSQRLATETAAAAAATANNFEVESDDDDGGGSSEHHPFFPLGTKVVKTFEDAGKMIPFKGEIKSYDAKEKLYLIEYEDEDSEELTREEVSNILVTRTQSLNDDDIATNASQTGDSRELVNSGVQTLRRPRIDEAGSKRKVAAAMPPAKRKQGRSRSEKQKETPRQNIADDLFRIGIALSSMQDSWNVNQSSFKSNELLPLDCVEFDKEKNRYQVTSTEDITEDDVILQAMVVFALYRMEKGWGQGRSVKALSIWGGKPANDTDDELFPLVNLWKEEIRQCISEKMIGLTTLDHFDNFENFPRFYLRGGPRSRWRRRSDSVIGQVHIFAEQAAIQLALHLHEHVSRDYAILSSLIIFTVLRDEKGELDLYLNSLIGSSRKETDCFPTTALNDILLLSTNCAYENDVRINYIIKQPRQRGNFQTNS